MSSSIFQTIKNRVIHINRYPGVWPAIIIFSALMFRYIALMDLRDSIYFNYLLWDEKLYFDWAKQIADGTYASNTAYQYSPLPAYVMALVYKVFSVNHLYARILNIIFGILSCYMVFLTGVRIGGRTIGIVAGLAATIYHPFILYSIVPLKTSMGIFLFSLALFIFISIVDHPNLIKNLFLAIVLGLLINIRPNFIPVILFILFIILITVYQKVKSFQSLTLHLVVFSLGLFISLAPFIIRNYRVSSEIVFTTTHGGYNLYLGNNLDNQYPYYRPVSFALPTTFDQGIQFIIEASHRENKELTPKESSKYWFRQVNQTAWERPGFFLFMLGKKILASFNSFESSDHYHIGFLSQFIPFFRWPLLQYWLVFPLGMAALLMNYRRGKIYGSIGIIFLIFISTMMLFYPNTRYRLHTLVIIIPFSVLGAYQLFTLFSQKRLQKAFFYSGLILMFFVIEFLPLKGVGDLSAYCNTHAIVLNYFGKEKEAAFYWKKSSQMEKSYSDFANLALAKKYIRMRDFEQADRYLNKISDNSFASASKYSAMGDLKRHQGKLTAAIDAYEKSLEINSGQRKPLSKLLLLYTMIKDRKKALHTKERLKEVNSFYDNGQQ